jgi:hypothetical protein
MSIEQLTQDVAELLTKQQKKKTNAFLDRLLEDARREALPKKDDRDKKVFSEYG